MRGNNTTLQFDDPAKNGPLSALPRPSREALHRGIAARDLILPLFVIPGKRVTRYPLSLPGIEHNSLDLTIEKGVRAWRAGIESIVLFAALQERDPVGGSALRRDGLVPKTMRALKDEVPDLRIIADLCFCQHTSHGHCGVVVNGELDNDVSLRRLAELALVLAEAGADVLMPSGMLDGAVAAVRSVLDSAGHRRISIMSQTVKYASSFYGPFRSATEMPLGPEGKSSYQVDPGSHNQALREVELDIAEGADAVMVKPSLGYLDMISAIKRAFNFPTAAFVTSGEYSMIKAAALKGWIDEEAAANELILAIRRAGADMIVSYWSLEIAEKISKENYPEFSAY